MAVTTESSPQAKAILGTGPKLASYKDQGSVMHLAFNFVQGAAAGDATSTARLCKIPPGTYRMHRLLSFVWFTAFGASRVLDIGWEAYRDKDGTAVSASAAGLNNDIDVSATGSALIGTAITVGYKDFESRDGVWIVATVAGGTIPAAAQLDGILVLSK